MHHHRSAVLSALISLALVGCAITPTNQQMNRDIAAAVQPLDVKVGIQQAELYATMAPSRNRGGGAAACAAVPGVGILAAAVCASVAGAVNASVDAKRFKAANDKAQPLKEALVDVQFDELMNSAVAKSLQTIPGMQVTGVSVTKTVNDQAYEQSFRASNANSVMFVTVDYHITGDFTTLNISARGMLYPRSAAARVAAGPTRSPSGGEATGAGHEETQLTAPTSSTTCNYP